MSCSWLQPLRINAEMPLRSGALSKQEFDAIVAEAREISQQTHDTRDLSHWPSQWRTGLDRSRLVALWRMPESAQLEEPERDVLVEQAADWDLLQFDRPSDAAVLWTRLWPLGQSAESKAPNSVGLVLRPDANWSDNAVAMVSVFTCFPRSTWTATGDAAAWATTHSVSWNWYNSTGWDALRGCLEETVKNDPWSYEPAASYTVHAEQRKRRYDAVVEILKAKFTRELSKDGCRRDGPDSCLLIYQALFALDRKNPQLVALLHEMERGFELDRPLVLPDGSEQSDVGTEQENANVAAAAPPTKNKKKKKVGVSAAQLQRLEVTLAEAERRKVFLTLKMPVLLEHPEGWPRGELDRTLRQAMDMTLAIARIQYAGHRHFEFERYFSDSWHWIDAATQAANDPGLQALGASYAGSVGCELVDFNIDADLAPFWRGYEIENIRLGHGSCGALARLNLPEIYQAIAHPADAVTAARLTSAVAPIAAALSDDGDLRTQALDAMESACHKMGNAPAQDPWKLCAGIADRDAEKAQLERQRFKAEQARLAAIEASKPPPDPYACGDSVVMLAVKSLGYKGDAEFWNSEQTACRLRPEDPTQAIVALTYTDGDQSTGVASENNDTGYDLDVLVIRIADGSIVARNAPRAHIDSDAIRFNGLGIDTAKYALAPGRRAFGIRVRHDSHCHMCAYGETDLVLYLQQGLGLDAVLETAVEETRGTYGTSDCDDVPTQSMKTIAVAPTVSHGLADLVLTTTSKSIVDDDVAAAACSSQPNNLEHISHTKLMFDGRVYNK